MKAMKNHPSVMRTEYAYALLFEKNKKKADKILEKFESITEKYPYENEIASEHELINIALERYRERL